MKITKKIKSRFFNNVKKTDYCWEWIGAKNSDGYGQIMIDRKFFRSHRLSYSIHYGNFNERLFICHRCDNPSCVNPEHLFCGTHTDNMRDMVKKGRENPPRQYGKNNPNHKLTKREVEQIRNIDYLSQRKIATLFGVSQNHIKDIIKNRYWKVSVV